MQSVDEQKGDGKPFFAYLSFQAVHSPFAVPDEWLDRYKGQYDKGYDVLRAERLARMKDMGLVGEDATGFPRLPTVPAWDTLTPEQRQVSARKMEVYAAMLSNMDHHIGRVLDHLRANGQLDNTLVIFIVRQWRRADGTARIGGKVPRVQALAGRELGRQAGKLRAQIVDLRLRCTSRVRNPRPASLLPLQYGLFAREIADRLAIQLTDSVIAGVLVDVVDPGFAANEHNLWVLRPNAAQALEDLGWAPTRVDDQHRRLRQHLESTPNERARGAADATPCDRDVTVT